MNLNVFEIFVIEQMENGSEFSSDCSRIESVGLDQLHNLFRPVGQTLCYETAISLK